MASSIVATGIEAGGGTAMGVPVDVADPDRADEMAAAVVDRLGGIDLLVNNAATTSGAGGGMENVDLDDFQHLFEVNFWGALRLTQALLVAIAVPLSVHTRDVIVEQSFAQAVGRGVAQPHLPERSYLAGRCVRAAREPTSSPDVGSSRKTRSGSCTRARANASF